MVSKIRKQRKNVVRHIISMLVLSLCLFISVTNEFEIFHNHPFMSDCCDYDDHDKYESYTLYYDCPYLTWNNNNSNSAIELDYCISCYVFTDKITILQSQYVDLLTYNIHGSRAPPRAL